MSEEQEKQKQIAETLLAVANGAIGQYLWTSGETQWVDENFWGLVRCAHDHTEIRIKPNES